MRKRTFNTAGALAALALALCAALPLSSCGGDDDEEGQASGAALSEETTAVRFSLYDGSFRKYMLFDYAGGKYVGSDTVSGKTCSVILRQGMHHLVWMDGLDYFNNKTGAGYVKSGAEFNPKDKTVTTPLPYGLYDDVAFSECDFEVTPSSTQGGYVKCEDYVTCVLRIEPTDGNGNVSLSDVYSGKVFGKVTGLPLVTAVALTGSRYETKGQAEMVLFAAATYSDGAELAAGFQYEGKNMDVNRRRLLCPEGGIDGIQLTVEARDAAGGTSKKKLPKFSLRRAHTTTLRGPVFSGTAADWTVTTEPGME